MLASTPIGGRTGASNDVMGRSGGDGSGMLPHENARPLQSRWSSAANFHLTPEQLATGKGLKSEILSAIAGFGESWRQMERRGDSARARHSRSDAAWPGPAPVPRAAADRSGASHRHAARPAAGVATPRAAEPPYNLL